jgi:hypothetical protein
MARCGTPFDNSDALTGAGTHSSACAPRAGSADANAGKRTFEEDAMGAGIDSHFLQFSIRLTASNPPLTFPITGGGGSVKGFNMTPSTAAVDGAWAGAGLLRAVAEERVSQADADHLAARLQALYDTLPETEQRLCAALLAQAATGE